MANELVVLTADEEGVVVMAAAESESLAPGLLKCCRNVDGRSLLSIAPGPTVSGAEALSSSAQGEEAGPPTRVPTRGAGDNFIDGWWRG
eukprot:1650231-Pyramimonas_sp.AAC.2